jgi:hypothetical protein
MTTVGYTHKKYSFVTNELIENNFKGNGMHEIPEKKNCRI